MLQDFLLELGEGQQTMIEGQQTTLKQMNRIEKAVDELRSNKSVNKRRYTVSFEGGQPRLRQIVERVKRPDPVVVAYDIETTKAPLKVFFSLYFSFQCGADMKCVCAVSGQCG